MLVGVLWSGTFDQFAELRAHGTLDPEQRALAFRVVTVLLYEQLIVSNILGTRVFRVMEGSGMGLKHSSVVAVLALRASSYRDW